MKIDETNFTWVIAAAAGAVVILVVIVVCLACFLCCRIEDAKVANLPAKFDVESAVNNAAGKFKAPHRANSVFDNTALQLAQGTNESGFMKATLPVDPNESVSFHESQLSGRNSQFSNRRKFKLKTWDVLRPLNLHTKYYGNFLAAGVETVDEFVNLSDAGIAMLKIEVRDMAKIKA